MTEPMPTPEKADPETLVLRAKPRRVVRFRRPVLIGMGAVGAVAIAGITWMGLSPAIINPISVGEAPANLEKQVRPPVESLSGLPKSYAEVPRLGPPLPGDLGGAMLQTERARKGVNMENEDGRRYKDTEDRPSVTGNAVQSGLFFTVAPGFNTQASPVTAEVSATVTKASVPVFKVQAGTILAANLVTGLNSDLEGIVIAQISEAVFDTATGRQVLIPQGSRLLGRYERATAFRQSRIQVLWEKLLMPDGRTLTLTGTRASDEAGFAGLTDQVNYHGGAMLRGVLLSTFMGLAEAADNNNDSDLERAVRDAAGQTLNETGQRIVSKTLDAAPTLIVRPGWPVRIILSDDLILPASTIGAAHG